MTYKLIKKAYGVNWDKIDEGDYYRGNISPVYAEGRNEAKSLLLSEVSDYNLRFSDEDITYLNAPIIRYKDCDKYEFKGKELTLRQIEDKKRQDERDNELQSILNDESIIYCYIRKGSYYRPNSCGYTDRRDRAGVYTKEEAVSSARSCQELSIIPIDIKEHNKMIQFEINELNERLLNYKTE